MMDAQTRCRARVSGLGVFINNMTRCHRMCRERVVQSIRAKQNPCSTALELCECRDNKARNANACSSVDVHTAECQCRPIRGLLFAAACAWRATSTDCTARSRTPPPPPPHNQRGDQNPDNSLDLYQTVSWGKCAVRCMCVCVFECVHACVPV